MNILFEKKNTNSHILVTEVTENHETLFPKIKNELSKIEVERYNKFKNKNRKTEWLGVRLTLKKMLGKYYEIKYNKYGNPYLNYNKNISISHSNGIIGIMISDKTEIGIDVEILNDKILRTAHKFITTKEIEQFKEDEKLNKIYLNWCCKETLFKIKEKGGYDFKDNFKILDSNLENFGIKKAIISQNNTEEYYSLNYQFTKYNNKEILIVWL